MEQADGTAWMALFCDPQKPGQNGRLPGPRWDEEIDG
jgi:hypothetical protein